MGAVANKSVLQVAQVLLFPLDRQEPEAQRKLTGLPTGAQLDTRRKQSGVRCRVCLGFRAALLSLKILLCKEVGPHPARVIGLS